jgi:2-polyprenyl-6-methoxyphenol hydroxylase-like FAD-dependent oxidoreductase
MGGSPTKLDAADICIVGAGPVGLWTAYNILLNAPESKIVVYDKRADYARSHILNIDMKELIDNINHYSRADANLLILEISNLMQGSHHISTKALEDFLRTKVVAFGDRVEFRIAEIKNPSVELQNFDIIIGADGARSIIRRKIFCDDLSVRENLQKVLMVSFDIDAADANRPLRGYLANLSNIVKSKMIHDVRYGTGVDGKIPVTLTVIPSRKMQTAMSGGPRFAADPWDVFGESLPGALKESVLKILKLQNIQPENLQNLNIRCVELNNYAANTFTKCNNAKWFLVGDSASGVPFFRSLNKGLKEGLYLANELHKFQLGQILNFTGYNDFMKTNTQSEIRRARAYSAAINARRTYLTWTGGSHRPFPVLAFALVLVAIVFVLCATSYFLKNHQSNNLYLGYIAPESIGSCDIQ